jgi:YggT family protein
MTIICNLLTIYMLMIVARIVLSYFPLDPDGAMATVAGFLFIVTDPVLGPIRRAVPPLRLGGAAIDLSPLVVLIGIQILQAVIC